MSTTNDEITQGAHDTEKTTEGTEEGTEEMEEGTETTQDMTGEQNKPAQGVEAPPHPYAAELSAFKPTPEQPVVKEPVTSRGLKDTPVVVVETEEQLQKMLEKLETASELAFNMEYNITRSFQGIADFFQISTRTEDFIIDPVTLKGHLSALNKVFTDPTIVKVMYGGKMTRLEGLQRDFGVFVVNYFDLSIAEDELGLKKKRSRSQRQDLSKLLSSIVSVRLDPDMKKFDKSVRPFSQELIDYEREGTRHLLHVYDVFRNRLIEKNMLENVYTKCKEFCEVVWYPEKYARRPDSAPGLCAGFTMQGKLNEMQRELVEVLCEWRWNTAKANDWGLQFLLSNNHIHNIIRVLPKDLAGVELCCFNETSDLVKEKVNEILGFVAQAKAKFPDMKIDNTEVLARLNARMKYGKATKKCPECKTYGHFPKDCYYRKKQQQPQTKGGVRQPGPTPQWRHDGQFNRPPGPTAPWRHDGQFNSRGFMRPANHQGSRMRMGPLFGGGPRGPPRGPFPLRPPMGFLGPMRPRGRGRFQPY